VNGIILVVYSMRVSSLSRSSFGAVLSYFVLLLFWCPLIGFTQGLVINEVMASNINTIVDEDGDFEDWIELYNAGDTAVNLEGWGLSDEPDHPFQWTFPPVTVQPGDYLLVWASGKDRNEGHDEPEPPVSSPALENFLEFRGSQGVNSNITPREAFTEGEQMSFAAWIHPEADQGFIWYGFNNGGDGRWDLRYNNGVFSLQNHGSPSLHWDTPADYPPGQWYFVVWTYDSEVDNIARIYVNGERTQLIGRAGARDLIPEDGTDGTTGGHPISLGTNHMILGMPGPGVAGTPFVGRIGSVHLWNRFLNDEEVGSLFADLGYAAELSDGAVLFWHIDEGSGNILADASSNNRFGVFTVGDPSWGPAFSFPHTNFRISADGDPIILTNPGGVVVDRLPPRPAGRGLSVGRSPNGEGDWVYFMEPTPGASNDSAIPYEDILEPPQFSTKRGWYDDPFELELVRSNKGSTIYYTLDGPHPTADNGIVYTGEPISIDGISMVRAVEHKEGFVPSVSASHTYLFFDQVIAQSSNPEGWPSTWGLGGNDPLDGGKFQSKVQANYGMHPTIVSDPEYAQMLKRGFDEMPVISLTMDPEDIFGDEYGILTYPDRSRSEMGLTRDQIYIVERPVSMEFFDRASDEEFQIDAGIRIQGGSSTRNWKVLKLSKRLFFRADYGKTRLDHPFFPDSEVESFRTLVLSGGHNLTWQHPDHAQRVMGQFVRDVFMSDLHRSMGSLSPHDRYAHLFLNGLYWGKYYVRNRPDATFMADNLGGSQYNYDVLRHDATTVVDGNSASFDAMMKLASADLSSRENYQALGEMLDLPAFVDYMLFNFWAGNTDWSRHNWYAGRKREDGAKWRFFSWDAEHVLKSVNQGVLSGSTGEPHTIFNHLLASPEFRLLFGDHGRRHFFNGGVFEVDTTASAGWASHYPERNRAVHLYRKRIAEVDNSMALETARWGDTRPHPNREMYTRNEDWMAELNRLVNTYFPNRSGIVLSGLRSAGLYSSVDPPVFDPHGGAVWDGLTVGMSGPDGTIYYTLNGEDPRAYGTGQISASAIPYGGEGVATTGASVIKARVLDVNGEWSALTEAHYVEPPIKPYRLAQGPYVFHYWDRLAPAGTYPEGMIFEQAKQSDPRLPTQLNEYWRLPYNLTSRSRINGLGYQGISFINTANAQEAEGAGYVGSAILALDTTTERNLYVQWTAGTVTPNERAYGLRLQYRVGGTGAFEDVMGANMFPLEYRSNPVAGHAEVFGPVRLPGEMQNQPYVELRWKYYHRSGGSGPRAELRLDNIVVTGESDSVTDGIMARRTVKLTVRGPAQVVDTAETWTGLIDIGDLTGQTLEVTSGGDLTLTGRVQQDGLNGDTFTILNGGTMTSLNSWKASNNAGPNSARIFLNAGTWRAREVESHGDARNSRMIISGGVLMLEHQIDGFDNRYKPWSWLENGFLHPARGYELVFEDWEGNAVDPTVYSGLNDSMKIYAVPKPDTDPVLAFVGYEGGPFKPLSNTIDLVNENQEAPFNWAAVLSVDWLTVDPSSGVLSPWGEEGYSMQVSVELNRLADELLPGDYYGTIYFRDATGASPLPPLLVQPIGFQELKEAGATLKLDLSDVFITFADGVSFEAQSTNAAVAPVSISQSILTVTPSQRGEAAVTVYVDDGYNPPTPTSFRVLVYPAAHAMANGLFTFDYWSPDEPDGSYPEHMLFLQSNESDTRIDTALEYAYSLTEEEYHSDDHLTIGFPYNNTRRTRLNGLGGAGIAFINTGRARALGGALLAVNTLDVDFVTVGWLAGTVLPNNREYAIRLQYRVGTKGEFKDVFDQENESVEYVRDETTGHLRRMGPVNLPLDALGEEYVQLLWRYYKISGESGPRAQLRLNEIVVSSAELEVPGFAAWQKKEFTEAELQETSISGPLGDPDGTGVQNLLRYALGLGRHEPYTGAIPRFESTSEGLIIRFRRRIDANRDVISAIEWTGDPGDASSWTDAEAGQVIVFLDASPNHDGLTEEVAYHLSLPVSELPRAFFRLRVLLEP